MKIPSSWTFRDNDVAQGFDKHVREQLPWYDLATFSLAHIARHYIPQGGVVYDVGASTGNFGRSIVDTLNARSATLYAIEESSEMAARYQESKAPGELIVKDACSVTFKPFDFMAMFLVLMFVPVEKRAGLLRSAIAQIKVGGAIVVFDKFECPGGYRGTMLRRLTLAAKLSGEVTDKMHQEILEKELSLAGIQRPMNSAMLKHERVETTEVFRFGEFAGYLLERFE